MKSRFLGDEIKNIDLTEALRQRAKSLFDMGKSVFWRDDTHWNGEGMAVAADAIASCLAQK
jgi:hypothetical protein